MVLSLYVLIVGLAAASSDSPQSQDHAALVQEASLAVDRAAAHAALDPLRPIYHVTAAARFINDPNGPVFFNGEYHVFFQHLPYWSESREWTRPMWGHAVSADLVHWRHMPIALAPEPGTYDADGIASGCCVINGDTPTIIYTGVGSGRQAQCLATSKDNLRTWQKCAANPVVPERPLLEGLGDGFRDPCAWREGNEWRMLVGSALKERGGTVLLYQSNDLRQWEFLGPLCTGMGERCIQWECPTFFPLGGRHVLIVSPLYRDAPGLRGMVEYSVGSYHDNRFDPGPWRPVDLGGPAVYYAPNSFSDAQGRRILWSWIMADRPPSAGWSHCLSLPRVLTLAEDETLRYEPAPELATLRGNARVHEELALQSGGEVALETNLGLHVEIEAQIELRDATRVELRFGGAGDRGVIAYDTTGKFTFGDKQAEFRLEPGENVLHLRVFIDGCIGEVYLNGRACFSNLLPFAGDTTGVSIRAVRGTAFARRIGLWEMSSIWGR